MRALCVGLSVSYFIACFCGLSTVYTFGYWVPALLKEFDASNARAQVVVALMQSGFLLGGVFARPTLKRWSFQAVYAFGGAAASIVLLVVSFAPNLACTYAVFIAGCGLQWAWLASSVLIQRHLPMKVATRCSAFASTGSGFGTIAWSAAAREMLPRVGWRNSFRVIGAAWAFLHIVGAAFQKEPEPLAPTHGETKAGYRSLLRAGTYRLFFAAVAVGGFGYNMVFAVLASHAEANGVSTEDVSTIYMVFGLFAIVGRVLAGILGSWAKPLHVWGVAHFFISGGIVAVAYSRTVVHFAVANATLGLSSGPMIALRVPCCRELMGVERIPEAVVLIMVLQAGTTLMAPTLAGFLKDQAGSFVPGLLIGASGVAVGGILVLAASLAHGRKPLDADADGGAANKADLVDPADAELSDGGAEGPEDTEGRASPGREVRADSGAGGGR